MIAGKTNTQAVIGYHERTKHHMGRYARSAGYLDWANQPNPFRLYPGAQALELPLTDKFPELTYAELFKPVSGPGTAITLQAISRFLQLAMGLSAWKQAGASRWALRINPSSGNLHPTECHIIVPPGNRRPGGMYHYSPLLHTLEKRADLDEELGAALLDCFGGPGFFVGLSTVFWRESWKYGERAFRYCNLDAGHALAALALSARFNGWTLTGLNRMGDDQIASLLGFDRTDWPPLEAESPELLCRVSPGRILRDFPGTLPADLVKRLETVPLAGNPNTLSENPVNWGIIFEAADAAKTPSGAGEKFALADAPFFVPPTSKISAAGIIRQRRSAVSFNPRHTIPAEAFAAILDRTRPRPVAPFNAAFMPPAVQLLLFVHRVSRMDPGLYLFGRVPNQVEELRNAADSHFLWRPVHEQLPLWLLKAGDVTYDAMELCCHQEIAGNSAFCVGMIAYFAPLLEDHPHRYRHLHWECGMIGQLLYLEAEAQGLRGTGIGCFFDDGVHDLLGLKDNRFQSLYHFTIGQPVEDRRLSTLPAYFHLKRP